MPYTLRKELKCVQYNPQSVQNCLLHYLESFFSPQRFSRDSCTAGALFSGVSDGTVTRVQRCTYRGLVLANDAGHKSTVTKGVAMFRSCEF